MALDITKNENGLYNVKSTISNEQLHDSNFVGKEEVKRILINTEMWKLVDKILEIDYSFPNGYFINGKKTHKKGFYDYYQTFKNDEERINKVNEIFKSFKWDTKF